MRRDCIVGMLREHDEASDEELGNVMRRVARKRVHKCNQSCISGVGVAQPQLKLHLQTRSCVVTAGVASKSESELEMGGPLTPIRLYVDNKIATSCLV